MKRNFYSLYDANIREKFSKKFNDQKWLNERIKINELTEFCQYSYPMEDFKNIFKQNFLNIGNFEKGLCKLLDENLPSGDICSVASGEAVKEYYLLKNQTKSRNYYCSDLFYDKQLNLASELVKEKNIKNRIFAYEEPVNAIKLPYKDNRFDGCFVAGVIYSLDDDELIKHISELLRVTKKNGKIIFWCLSFIPPLMKIKLIINKIFKTNHNNFKKNVGFERDVSEISKILNNFENLNILWKKRMFIEVGKNYSFSAFRRILQKIPIIKNLWLYIDYKAYVICLKK